MKVSILMSTYNGEVYLNEQLDSIIAQSFPAWELYIRDDGSTDSTIDIIETYCQIDPRIKLLQDNCKHIGPKKSFLWLLEHVESDYYLFCDQDDVWDTQKVLYSYNAIEKIPKERPALAVTDLLLVDKNLNTLQSSMWKAHKINNLTHNKNGLVIASMFPGCSMIFNRAVRDLVIKESFDFPMHDIKISFVTKRNGGVIIPIDIPLIKYRQHPQNVIGLYSGGNILLHKLKQFANTYKENLKYYKIVHQYLYVSPIRYILLKVYHLLGII